MGNWWFFFYTITKKLWFFFHKLCHSLSYCISNCRAQRTGTDLKDALLTTSFHDTRRYHAVPKNGLVISNVGSFHVLSIRFQVYSAQNKARSASLRSVIQYTQRICISPTFSQWRSGCSFWEHSEKPLVEVSKKRSLEIREEGQASISSRRNRSKAPSLWKYPSLLILPSPHQWWADWEKQFTFNKWAVIVFSCINRSRVVKQVRIGNCFYISLEKNFPRMFRKKRWRHQSPHQHLGDPGLKADIPRQTPKQMSDFYQAEKFE